MILVKIKTGVKHKTTHEAAQNVQKYQSIIFIMKQVITVK